VLSSLWISERRKSARLSRRKHLAKAWTFWESVLIPATGLKKGSVVNIEKTVASIRSSIEEAKLMAGIEDLDSATIGIAGNHIFCFNSSGVVPVKNKEINQSDVDRVIDAAKAVLIPSDQ
jgi:cell division protein FtsA